MGLLHPELSQEEELAVPYSSSNRLYASLIVQPLMGHTVLPIVTHNSVQEPVAKIKLRFQGKG